jgi:hypothetical protein
MSKVTKPLGKMARVLEPMMHEAATDKASGAVVPLLFALLCLCIAVVSFTIAIICGGIYSAVSCPWSFANKKFTKGVLWAGPALLVGNAFLIHPADETWTQMCIGWLIAIPLAGAVDLVRIVRSTRSRSCPRRSIKTKGPAATDRKKCKR